MCLNEEPKFKLIINQFVNEMVKKSIEQTFQKMSPRDHVLKRPQTYVGSVGM